MKVKLGKYPERSRNSFVRDVEISFPPPGNAS
jgi:hypothetical protein